MERLSGSTESRPYQSVLVKISPRWGDALRSHSMCHGVVRPDYDAKHTHTHTVCHRRLPVRVVFSLLVFGDEAEQAVFFVGDASCEKDAVSLRKHIPQAVELEGRTIGAHQRLDKGAARRIVNVNEAVTEVADPKFIAFYESKSPGSVQVSV